MDVNLKLIIEIDCDPEDDAANFICGQCLHNCTSNETLLAHQKTAHESSCNNVTKEKLMEWWETVGGIKTDLTADAVNYFMKLFSSYSSPDELFHKFSCDGITCIPSLFFLPRKLSLCLTRKLFDVFLSRVTTVAHNKKGKHLTLHKLTRDEEFIIQYIGGYILQKLTKRCINPREIDLLSCLTDYSNETSNSSLISALNNNNYGHLTVPAKSLVKLLMYVESVFRKQDIKEHIMESCMSSLSVCNIKDIFENLVFDECLQKLCMKICKFYVKIRCYQKANHLNSVLHVTSDQNVSLRKSLK
ncbi:uncharacterized protein LOC143471789 [Clavelina lepadiformis]|uniref:uncharacterized protein LOC143471789 n=1 Tax=Clavelina lepadiformis TaxID=159417 RepID=UPI00404318A7